jgi:hypothetical protein
MFRRHIGWGCQVRLTYSPASSSFLSAEQSYAQQALECVLLLYVGWFCFWVLKFKLNETLLLVFQRGS